MSARVLFAVGAAVGCAGFANAQMQTSAQGDAGNPYVAPAGGSVYSNPYDGVSTFGNAAQIFEAAFSGYDIWLGDDFSTGADFDSLELSSVGFLGNGGIDPFAVTDFIVQIFDGLPNDPDTMQVCQSDGFSFNGIDTWSGSFSDCCLPAGDYQFGFAADNDFGTNGQTFFFQQNFTQPVDNGWQWNPNGAFGFPGNLQFLTQQDLVTPASPNTVIDGAEAKCGGDECFADCDGNDVLNILDFLCYQGAFQDGNLDQADCDGNGVLNILDFLCYQEAFQDGCP
jgi:hypothetical protein